MLQLEALVGFTVPEWMLEKMRYHMQMMRTDVARPSKLLHDSTYVVSSQVRSCASGVA